MSRDPAVRSLAINEYGDMGVFVAPGHGADIASQRADDLDNQCLHLLARYGAPVAVDVGCGAGGQTVRMACAGATVLAIDHCDMGSAVMAAAQRHQVQSRIKFLQRDMRTIADLGQDGLAHAVVCQRAIHYLSFGDAVRAVGSMGLMLRQEGRLFISASGLASELGEGYEGLGDRLTTRYCELAGPMRTKHGIHGPVCLYSQADMESLLHAGGLEVEALFASPFGNIKAVAKRRA